MSNIGLSTQLFDLDGDIILVHDDTFDNEEITRRVAKVATLDGGVSASDLGYTSSDRVITIVSDVSREIANQLINMIKTHSDFWLTTREGAFTGKATRLRRANGRVRFEFTITGDA